MICNKPNEYAEEYKNDMNKDSLLSFVNNWKYRLPIDKQIKIRMYENNTNELEHLLINYDPNIIISYKHRNARDYAYEKNKSQKRGIEVFFFLFFSFRR